MRLAKMSLVRPVIKNGRIYRQAKVDIPSRVRHLFPKPNYDPTRHKSPYMTALTRNVKGTAEEATAIAEFKTRIENAERMVRGDAGLEVVITCPNHRFNNDVINTSVVAAGLMGASRLRFDSPKDDARDPDNLLDYRDVIDQWCKDKKLDAADRKRKAKIGKAEAFFNWLNKVRHVGYDMRQATQNDLLDYRRHLIDQINLGQMAEKTVEDYLFQVKGLFTYAFTELRADQKLASNPGTGISYKGVVQHSYEDFTLPEIAKILSAARNEPPCIRWFHWLAAYSGGRCAEICEAPAKDVEYDTEAGSWVLHIRRLNRTGKMKTLKTGEISERPVPIHDAVIAEGFITYVESVKDAHGEDAPLFPDLRLIRGRLNDDASKRNLEFLRRIGIASENNHKRNHSWRHVVKTRFRGTDTNGEHYIPREDVVDKLTGHANGSVGRKYGYFPIPVLRNAISRIPAWSVP